ncbi:hypothetical protein [Nocardioides zeae]
MATARILLRSRRRTRSAAADPGTVNALELIVSLLLVSGPAARSL